MPSSSCKAVHIQQMLLCARRVCAYVCRLRTLCFAGLPSAGLRCHLWQARHAHSCFAWWQGPDARQERPVKADVEDVVNSGVRRMYLQAQATQHPCASSALLRPCGCVWPTCCSCQAQRTMNARAYVRLVASLGFREWPGWSRSPPGGGSASGPGAGCAPPGGPAR